MSRKDLFFDKFGICGAGLCTIHCLFSGILISLIPGLGALFEGEWFHLGVLLITLPVAFLAVLSGVKKHKKKLPFFFLFMASLFILLGHFIEEGLLTFTTHATAITISGSLLLIFTHIYNMRLVKKESKESNHNKC